MSSRYEYELLPGHMSSPARYTSQRYMHECIRKYVGPEDARILDFGCGSAVFRFYFRDKDYFGFDISDHNFSEKEGPGVDLRVADGTNVPFEDSSFDFVFCNAVFEHIEEDSLAAGEAFRVLREGKYCLVVVPTSLSPIYDELPTKIIGKPGHGEHYYSRKQITGLLENAGFEVVKIMVSMGICSSVLKTVYVYQRELRLFFIRAVNRLFNKSYPDINIYMDTYAMSARDYDDLQRIHEIEYREEKGMKYVYRKLLEACFFLDRAIPFCSRFGGEWLAIARKPDRQGVATGK